MPTYLDLVDATAECKLDKPVRAVGGMPEEQPSATDDAEMADKRLERLIQEGLVRPPVAPFPAHILEHGPLCTPSKSVLEALLEERGHGR